MNPHYVCNVIIYKNYLYNICLLFLVILYDFLILILSVLFYTKNRIGT